MSVILLHCRACDKDFDKPFSPPVKLTEFAAILWETKCEHCGADSQHFFMRSVETNPRIAALQVERSALELKILSINKQIRDLDARIEVLR